MDTTTLFVTSLLFCIMILPRPGSSSDLKSKVRFKDASLTGQLEVLPGYYFDDSSSVDKLSTMACRSRVECGRACMLSADCGAAHFSTSGKVCTLFAAGVVNNVKTPMEGWVILLNKKVNVRKGWLGLADGPSERRGRTEAFLQGQWGSICDTSFGVTGWPLTFCADMGYTGVKTAAYARDQPEGEGTGYVAWQDISCGEPYDLSKCLQFGACGHYYDVVVECSGGK